MTRVIAKHIRGSPLQSGPLAAMTEDILQHADEVHLARSWPTIFLSAFLSAREGWSRIEHMRSILLSPSASIVIRKVTPGIAMRLPVPFKQSGAWQA